MTSSLRPRGPQPPPFANSGVTSHPNQFGPISTRMASNGSQQGQVPSQAMASPPLSETPRPNDNIMNRRGDLSSSLYQICLDLKARMARVPNFEVFIAEMEEEEAEAMESTDPVTSMWNCLRRGYPLMAIYNALLPKAPIHVDASRMAESKVGKAATFKFLQACLTDLKFPPSECFLITDLYGGDTTGFVKVTKVVNRVLGILESRGLLLQTESQAKEGETEKPPTLTYRQNLIKEIVTTERDYVQHLEDLQQFKKDLEECGAIAGDALHDIFLNLNALLDFQRRFLIRIEQQNHLPETQQNWGQLFIQYKESFRVYEPFIANQVRCNHAVVREWDKIKAAPISVNVRGMVEAQSVLLSFLVKPFQRLSKYPLLLEELRKKGGLDDDRKKDLTQGSAAATSILFRANEAIHKEQRLAAVSELQSRVEDWKGHQIDHFGELLLFGDYTVVKGEGAKEVEREYKVYLFDRILLCCKEINPNKPKNKMMGNNKALVDKKGKPRLQLKGRIFMQNVTDVVTMAKSEKQDYKIQIFWKGDPGVENFVIRFLNENDMNIWRDQVQMQKKALSESARSSGQTGTSETEFLAMKDQLSSLKNPHLDEDAEEGDGHTPTGVTGSSNFGMNRQASSNSLVSAGTTLSGSIRGAPPRFAMAEPPAHQPPLSVKTNIPPAANSPGEFGGNSYFSPGGDSPMSTRSSSQAGMFALPRQMTPRLSNEDGKHKTAPAMARVPSRDGTRPINGYTLDGRTVLRPSLPAMAGPANAQQQQNRSRSASTPDIQSNPGAPRRYANGQLQPPVDNVPVPPIPSHMTQMRAPIVRSQTSSPTNGTLPTRSNAHSPMHPRDRTPRPNPDPSNNYDQQMQQRLQAIPNTEPRRYQEGSCADASLQMMTTSATPAPLPASSSGVPYPTQLKIKVTYGEKAGHITIVVPIIIKHRSLIDRIDSKMKHVSDAKVAEDRARLRYTDEDGDYVTIKTDDDVQIAIDDWVVRNEEQLKKGIIPDFDLFWHEVRN